MDLANKRDDNRNSDRARTRKGIMKQSYEDDSGLKRLLRMSRLYSVFQENLLGGSEARKWVAKNIWKLKGGETVVDLGCGPGTILQYLPADVDYWGVDISENYIRAARKSFSARGTFFLGTARDFLNHDDSHPNSADLIVSNGLLHHLSDDEALEVLELSKRLMKADGRFLSIEGTFLSRQTRLSKWIVSSDRGRHVRSEQEWKRLIGAAFDFYSTSILTGLIRIPYTHIVIECQKQG